MPRTPHFPAFPPGTALASARDRTAVLISKHASPIPSVATPQETDRPSLAVALVTDDDDLLEVCARVLRNEHHVVFTGTHSGHAMLACLGGRRIDVLISELWMADSSGPALTRRMKRHQPGLQAIYLARPGTCYESENVLVRPFTRDDLLKRLQLLASRA